jgi:hypothetical protein
MHLNNTFTAKGKMLKGRVKKNILVFQKTISFPLGKGCNGCRR